MSLLGKCFVSVQFQVAQFLSTIVLCFLRVKESKYYAALQSFSLADYYFLYRSIAMSNVYHYIQIRGGLLHNNFESEELSCTTNPILYIVTKESNLSQTVSLHVDRCPFPSAPGCKRGIISNIPDTLRRGKIISQKFESSLKHVQSLTKRYSSVSRDANNMLRRHDPECR